MSVHLERAYVLLDQGRPELAEAELRRGLADDPHDPELHALLALCLADTGKLDAALEEADAAVSLAPDEGFGHYARARVLLEAKRPNEAETAIRAAMEDNPFVPAYWATLAGVHLHRREWAKVLEAADAGLEVDPEDVSCNNLRAMALVHLGRRDEAGATLAATLHHNPLVAATHANQGWALLHRGEWSPAMDHFREALRLEPGNDWARAGLVEAMKTRSPLYAVMLRYFLWMTRLSPRTRWMVMIGGLLGYRAVITTVSRTPGLEWLALPVMMLWFGFVYLSWTAAELFDVVLLLDPAGRHALTPEDRVHAGIVGGAFAVLVGWVVAVGVTGGALVPVAGAAVTALATLPLASALKRTGGRRLTLGIASALVAGLGLASWAAHAGGNPIAGDLLSFSLTVGAASTWLAALVPAR